VPTIETPSSHPSLKGEGGNPFWITKGSQVSPNFWIIYWKNRHFNQIKSERHHSDILWMMPFPLQSGRSEKIHHALSMIEISGLFEKSQSG
jgi:hypothetical protein